MREFEGEWFLGVLGKKLKDREREVERLRSIARSYEEERSQSCRKIEGFRNFEEHARKVNGRLLAQRKQLESQIRSLRAKVGAKTRRIEEMGLRAKAEMASLLTNAEANKSHLGRFYWPATAYCEAALPCI